ncbi:M42 family metallopeptidase [Anthocerotibacter panamensis]|uniref:M42 family metallopeptidase n=1 Tax=Anthocerotibacter panamensis TaxID=2857077 RepID=UPI0036F2F91A
MTDLRDELYATIEQLVLLHSPSGDEREMDHHLLQVLTGGKARVWQDEAGNVIAHFSGASAEKALAITAHKDEIGMIVHRVEADGRLRLNRLGGSFPWIYGEGVVDVLGRVATIPGILSFGSRHVSHQSPQKAQQLETALKWEHVWIETFLSPEALKAAGVAPGTRVVVGKHRKRPLRMGDRVASYTLDNKASMAVLLLLARELDNLPRDTYFIFSAQEEVGGLGALHFTHRTPITEMIALEVTPVSVEYPVQFNDDPVLLSADSYSYYDLGLNQRLEQCAENLGIVLQAVVLSGFGSDASLAVKQGYVAQVACLGFPTENTHGYEIASLQALARLYAVLKAYVSG